MNQSVPPEPESPPSRRIPDRQHDDIPIGDRVSITSGKYRRQRGRVIAYKGEHFYTLRIVNGKQRTLHRSQVEPEDGT